MKIIFKEKVKFLLNSAEERDTEQGVLICKNTLNELTQKVNEEAIFQLLSKFNKAYIGIEAHGRVTSSEYAAIQTLRELEQNASKNS